MKWIKPWSNDPEDKIFTKKGLDSLGLKADGSSIGVADIAAVLNDPKNQEIYRRLAEKFPNKDRKIDKK